MFFPIAILLGIMLLALAAGSSFASSFSFDKLLKQITSELMVYDRPFPALVSPTIKKAAQKANSFTLTIVSQDYGSSDASLGDINKPVPVRFVKLFPYFFIVTLSSS